MSARDELLTFLSTLGLLTHAQREEGRSLLDGALLEARAAGAAAERARWLAVLDDVRNHPSGRPFHWNSVGWCDACDEIERRMSEPETGALEQP